MDILPVILKADIIKTKLIDFLFDNVSCDLIINEPPFLRGKRWADLVTISDNFTTGYEIKSEYDNLQDIIEQITDYCKVYNKVYLVINEKFIKNQKIKQIPKNVGIIVFNDKSFSIKRKAKSKKLLDKQFMLSLLWRRDLEILVPEKKNADMEDLRDYVVEHCSVSMLQKQIISSLKSRYADSYKHFLIDTINIDGGIYTTVDDLRTITRIKKNPVF